MAGSATTIGDAKWSPQTLLYWVQLAIVAQTGVALVAVTPSAKCWHDLGFDSLDFEELAVEAEATFGMTIPDGAVEQMFNITEETVTVQHLADYLWARCKQARAAKPSSHIKPESHLPRKDDPTI
jgi:acyl carrier protein